MRARLKNVERGEYQAAPGVVARRVLYASWHPDQFGLARSWIGAFKERIDAHDCDRYQIPLATRINDEPPMAGTERALRREQIAERLKDVTDFVVVATPSYVAKQKADLRDYETSEFVWMVESSADHTTHVIWRAKVERRFALPSTIGTCAFGHFAKWHDVRDEGFEFPSRDDLASAQRFGGQIDEAVDLIRHHGKGRCPLCAGAAGQPPKERK